MNVIRSSFGNGGLAGFDALWRFLFTRFGRSRGLK